MSPKDFGKHLAKLREQRGLSASQLAEMMFVSRATVSRWESGTRTPDLSMLSRLASCLNVPYSELLGAVTPQDEPPAVMLVDDEKIILRGTIGIVAQALPEASVYGFSTASEALAFARSCRVDLALVDIELGKKSGLDLCRELIALNPRVNVVFLTAHPGYSLDAWDTGACGFLVKPLRREQLLAQMERLHYPVPGLSASEERSGTHDG